MVVRDGWVAGIDTLVAAVSRLEVLVGGITADTVTHGRARAAFLAARVAWKEVEMLATYYEPSTSKLINGPALPRVEWDEGPEVVFPPEGFQVIEEQLYGDDAADSAADALEEVRNLAELVTRLRNAAAGQHVTSAHVWDAARLHVARVSSLGLAGFDSPVARMELMESAAALRGLRRAVDPFVGDAGGAGESLLALVDSAVVVLARAGGPDVFDHFGFLTEWLQPVAHAVDAARRTLGVELPEERRAFAASAASLFEAGAFDPQAFASPFADPDAPSHVALGERLFHEVRVSGGGSRSCATCHDPARAFTDGLARSPSLSGGGAMRNAPTMLNAGLQAGSFYDLRTAYLEDQVMDVVRNPNEMHGSVEVAASRLARDSSYAAAFAGAFGGADSGAVVTGARVRSAIAAYVRSLVRLDSRFDRAVRGDSGAITPDERRGFNVFMGKGRCGTCHFAPLFNGTVPPSYGEAEVEVLGVPSRPVFRGARIDPDSGRFHVTRSAPHLHAFKTPTVRNVAVTAPYMHNGVFATLEEVVDFYDVGGGAGIGIALENQTLPPDSLRLSVEEKRVLVSFMKALTDSTRR